MFLLDTAILSALRRRDRHPEAVQWLAAQHTSDLHLSVMTVGEIQRGGGAFNRSGTIRPSPGSWLSGYPGY